MDEKITELILANSGEITREKDDYVVAVFPENKIDQAVGVFCEITDNHEYKAILTGGNKLFVYVDV